MLKFIALFVIISFLAFLIVIPYADKVEMLEDFFDDDGE